MNNKEEITKELQELAPILAKLQKPASPEAPGGYFMQFQETLLADIRKTEVKQELTEIAPVLATATKPVMGNVPAGYFTTLQDSILKQVKSERQPEKSGSTVNEWLESVLSRLFKPQLATAFAGFATLMLVAVMLFIKVEQCTDFECQLAQLTAEDVNSYVATHPDEFYGDVLDYSVSDKKLMKRQEKANAELERLFQSVANESSETSILD